MTMVDPALLICAINLAFIAALPRVFFRPGRLNRHWWLTAAPFAVAGAGVLLHAWPDAAVPAALRWLTSPVPEWLPMLRSAAVVAAACSIGLIAYTLGSHREPVSLWHQEHDTPARIVQHGAYERIRHPFYAAFQLALGACALAAPGPPTLAALLLAVVQLRRTALREEHRLLHSELGGEYRRYMKRTGRFLPRARYASDRLPERT